MERPIQHYVLISNSLETIHLTMTMVYGRLPINIVNQFISIDYQQQKVVYICDVSESMVLIPPSVNRLLLVLKLLQWEINTIPERSVVNSNYIEATKFI